MTTAKKRQEEKNLKILRELLAHEGNKYCFDCNQRGPTYVNMTIGSFVCTNCGGALRKYSHRVKSISMSNFSQNEMDFIKKRGNDICKRIYYGLCDNKMPPEFDTKNGMLDSHLRSKYELKKWFVEPTSELEEEAIRVNQSLFDRAEKSNSSTKSVGNKMISVNAASSMIIEPPRPNNSRMNNARASVELPSSNPPISTNGSIDPSKLSGGSVVKLPMPSTNSGSVSNLNSTKPSKSGSLIETNDLFANFNPSPTSGNSSFNLNPSTHNVPSSKSINFTMEPLAPIASSNAAASTTSNFYQKSTQQNQQIDKYAALAELDDLFSQSTQITPPTTNHPQQKAVFSGNQGYWGASGGLYANNSSPPANPMSQHNPFTLPQQQQQPLSSQNMNNPFTNPNTTQMAPNWSLNSSNQQPNINSSTNDFNPFGTSNAFAESTHKPANPNPFL